MNCVKRSPRAAFTSPRPRSRAISTSSSSTRAPQGYAAASAANGSNAEDDGPGIREVLRSFGLEVRQAMLNQLVIITTTGGAQPVAAGIDYEDWPEVVGTIAGDDTVLVICPDDQASQTR